MQREAGTRGGRQSLSLLSFAPLLSHNHPDPGCNGESRFHVVLGGVRNSAPGALHPRYARSMPATRTFGKRVERSRLGGVSSVMLGFHLSGRHPRLMMIQLLASAPSVGSPTTTAVPPRTSVEKRPDRSISSETMKCVRRSGRQGVVVQACGTSLSLTCVSGCDGVDLGPRLR